MNVLDTTEQLYMFYHNKNKYSIFKKKKRWGGVLQGWGKVLRSLHWEFTMNP